MVSSLQKGHGALKLLSGGVGASGIGIGIASAISGGLKDRKTHCALIGGGTGPVGGDGIKLFAQKNRPFLMHSGLLTAYAKGKKTVYSFGSIFFGQKRKWSAAISSMEAPPSWYCKRAVSALCI